jgi:hypothetical protein
VSITTNKVFTYDFVGEPGFSSAKLISVEDKVDELLKKCKDLNQKQLLELESRFKKQKLWKK